MDGLSLPRGIEGAHAPVDHDLAADVEAGFVLCHKHDRIGDLPRPPRSTGRDLRDEPLLHHGCEPVGHRVQQHRACDADRLMLTWPSSLIPSTEKWAIQNTSRSGGVSIVGSEQIVASGAGRWTASLSIPIKKPDQVLAARALLAGLDGRAGSVLVGPLEVSRAPWIVDWLGYVVTYGRGRQAGCDRSGLRHQS